MEYLVIFEESKDGGYFAYVPDLQGCTSFGETIEECRINIKEAIEIFVEESENDGVILQKPTRRVAELLIV